MITDNKPRSFKILADFSIKLPAENLVATMVNDTLNAIKTQQEEDKFGWIVEAK